MTKAFDSLYAQAYDAFYQHKDYAAECTLIEHLLHRYADGPIRCICDLGCGTGNHALPLAARGYEVVGVDRSEAMLVCAQEKLARLSTNARLSLRHGDLHTIELERQFDAVLMMFAVLGYQLEDWEVVSALRAARRHVRAGGLLLFDVWYGPAVLRQRPASRVKTIPTAQGTIVRSAAGALDESRHVCTVSYQLKRLKEGRVIDEVREVHTIRYFFPSELKEFLRQADFALVRLGAFPDIDRNPDDTTWNVLGVAQVVVTADEGVRS